MRQVSIIGCGWLGFPMATQLISDGFAVKGSTTTVAKLAILESAGIISYLIDLNEDNPQLDDFLHGSEILIVNIPPQLRKDPSRNYVEKIGKLLPFLQNSSVSKVLFVGSTSIYADDNTIVTEETVPNPPTESGRQLLEAEKLLFDNPHFKTTSVRFSGLIGGDRHPVKFLAGKPISDAEAPVNLIHQSDCIGIILAIILQNSWNEIYNASYPEHPTRIDYYSQKAVEYQLEPPLSKPGQSNGKIISSEKLASELGYRFRQKI